MWLGHASSARVIRPLYAGRPEDFLITEHKTWTAIAMQMSSPKFYTVLYTTF
jgi:hypothetical protein